MENATITKQGKGWRITFENGSSLLIYWHNIPEEWGNASINVWREKGQPVKLKNGDSIITKPLPQPIITKQNQGRNYQGQGSHWQKNQQRADYDPQNNNNQTMNSTAKSPYNFVPLNEKVIYPEDQDVFFDRYDEQRNTGFLNVNIDSKTSIFIRGNMENFLLVNGKPIVPGSSFRGLVRTMVEIASFSKLQFYNNSRFYFRTFFDKAKRLELEYNAEIANISQVGILYKNGRNFTLIPTQLVQTIIDTSYIDMCILNGDIWKVYTGRITGPNGEPLKRRNYEIEQRPRNSTKRIELSNKNQIIIDYKNDINRKGLDVLKKVTTDPYHKANGIPVFYQTDSQGDITSLGNTKNYRLPYHSTVIDHLYPDHTTGINNFDLATLIFGITDETQQEKSKATRVYFEDLFCETPVFDEECVLKILSNPKPTSFQLYLEQPQGADTSPDQLEHWNDSKAIIRGYKNYWHRNSPANIKEPCSYKVESFNIRRNDFYNYLKEIVNLNNINSYIDGLIHNNLISESSDARNQKKLVFNGDMKGYDNQLRKYIKDYFFLDQKQIKRLGIHSMQYAYIKPLKANNIFTGRIRFENLTDIELGALLFSLELPQYCCYKIGMGKPLGLGSIGVSISRLKLDNRKSRYDKLLNMDGSWNLPEQLVYKDFKKIFSEFILWKLGSKETDLWNVSRMNELKAMLHFDSSKQSKNSWLKATQYMELNEFRYRTALDTPVNVKTKYLQ